MSEEVTHEFVPTGVNPRDIGEQYLDALRRGDEAALYRFAEMYPDQCDLFLEIRSTFFLAKPAE